MELAFQKISPKFSLCGRTKLVFISKLIFGISPPHSKPMKYLKILGQIEFVAFSVLAIIEALLILTIIFHVFGEGGSWDYIILFTIVIPFILFWLNKKGKIRLEKDSPQSRIKSGIKT